MNPPNGARPAVAADPPGERELALAEDAARWRFIRDHLFVWPEPDIKGERRPWLGVKFGHGWVPSEGAPPGGASAWPEEVDRAVDAMRATRHSPAAALAALPDDAPTGGPSEDEFVIARWLWEHKPNWRTPWLATDPAFRRLQAARVREVLDAQAALRAGAAAPRDAEPPLAYARAMRDTAGWLREMSDYGLFITRRREAFQAKARELDRIIEQVEGEAATVLPGAALREAEPTVTAVALAGKMRPPLVITDENCGEPMQLLDTPQVAVDAAENVLLDFGYEVTGDCAVHVAHAVLRSAAPAPGSGEATSG